MENWSDKQNEPFGNLFEEVKPRYYINLIKTDALTILKLNDENFTKLYLESSELTGDCEDIDLCLQRAKYLNLTTNKQK